MNEFIKVHGANEHNLKNVSLEIPKNKLVVFTGVSGSGKSSLAMDTIFAEGQRRYVESLSSYARQFLGVMKKPAVESIEGLSPAIAIDQKTVSHNPRSTVGTVTEIYDYMRLLFARIGHPHCPNCGREIEHLSVDQIVGLICKSHEKSTKQTRIMILSPLVKDRKGEYNQLFGNLIKQGYARVRIDGKVYQLKEDINLIKTNKHTVEVIVDRLVLTTEKIADKEFISRLSQSVETALTLGNGFVISTKVMDSGFEFPEAPTKMQDHLYSERFACPVCNISLPEIEPRSFSFNSPHGACEVCTGLGTELKINTETIIADELSVLEGGIIPWASLVEKDGWNRAVLEALSRTHGIDLRAPLNKLTKEKIQLLLKGTGSQIYDVFYKGRTVNGKFEGVVTNLERRYKDTDSEYIRHEIEKYMIKEPCPKCKGDRLSDKALSVTIHESNIAYVSALSVKECKDWITNLEKINVSKREIEISTAIIREIESRLEFLIDVGLSYLTISRASATLAGGEAQRIRLASQIGSKLSGVLYVLDEPSVGLHTRDHSKLIKTLKDLRDLGNTVLVVEHDEQTMLESDYIFDFGPGAGHKGGTLVASGTPEELKNNEKSITGPYLSGKKKITADNYFSKEDLKKIKEIGTVDDNTKWIKLVGASGHNLKNIDVDFPLNKLISVTGVSGSGKSTLINETLLALLREEKGLKNDHKPADCKGIIGAELVDKIISIDQNPIGRTPRSNPATYTKVFDEIRELFAQSKTAKIRGYKAGRFSFNVKGGRCEACQGDGQNKIEMQFMPDVYVDCEVCGGKRYNRETLEVEYKDKTVADVLDLTVDDALAFFEHHTKIHDKLMTLHDVGLGYITLGQSATTLSGGEAQRVKLAAELSKKGTGKTFYVLDEPTTGLHFADLERLISIMRRLVLKGNTVLVIEHNLDIIKNSDWIIDLGPDGGKDGGEVIFTGSIADLLKDKKSYTADSLRKWVV